MAEILANNAKGVLASSITEIATSITLEVGHTFPLLGAGDSFRATLFEVSGGEEVNHEIVRVTGVSGDTLTVERALEGTTARTWSTGTSIELRLTAGGALTSETASPQDGALVRYSGTSGNNLTDSGVIVDDDGIMVGYGRGLVAKTGDFTLSSSEKGVTLECDADAGGIGGDIAIPEPVLTITIPEDANVSLPVGYTTTVVQAGPDAIFVAPEGAVSLRSRNGLVTLSEQWGVITLYKRGSDDWVLYGDLDASVPSLLPKDDVGVTADLTGGSYDTVVVSDAATTEANAGATADLTGGSYDEIVNTDAATQQDDAGATADLTGGSYDAV